MTVRVVIADDEPVARLGLRDMLGPVEWLSVVGEAADGPAAVNAIDTLRPDLVFLDIQMPGLLGTDVLRTVTHQPFVIFTTAFGQHAVTAFELGALDYLLKPFGPTRLKSALERVKAAIGASDAHAPLDRMREALSQGPMRRLFVRSGAQLIPVPVESVAYLESDGDYVIAHSGTARHMLHVALSRLEARLDPAKFLRIHRTHIVNLDHVRAFKRTAKGQMIAELSDGTRLAVGRSRAAELRQLGY